MKSAYPQQLAPETVQQETPVLTIAVAENKAPAQSPGLTCAQCGAAIAAGKAFCRKCGHAVAPATLEEPNYVTSAEPQPPAPETVQQEISVSSHADAEDEVPALPTGPICAQCGALIAAGKAFCRKCGHAVGTPVSLEPDSGSLPEPDRAAPVEVPKEAIETSPGEPLAATDQEARGALPATPVLTCVECGTAIATGKAFCRKCGHAVSVTARPESLEPAAAQAVAFDPLVLAALHPSPVVPDANPAPVTHWKSLLQSSEEPAQSHERNLQSTANLQQGEPCPQEESAQSMPAVMAGTEPLPLAGLLPVQAAPQANTEPLGGQLPTDEPVEESRILPPQDTPPPKFELGPPDDVPRFRRSVKPIVGIAAAVMVAVAVGVSWYVVHQTQIKRNQSQYASVKTPDSTMGTTATKPNPGTPMMQTVVAPLAPKTAQGESSGAARQTEKSAMQTPFPLKVPPPAPVSAPHPISNLPPDIVSQATPVFARTTSPAPPRKGVLHYAGAPVSFGGTVVFGNLPKDRLRFTFDRGAWQPLIRKNPDGTQTLTLRSIKQELQTSCDVGWEISE